MHHVPTTPLSEPAPRREATSRYLLATQPNKTAISALAKEVGIKAGELAEQIKTWFPEWEVKGHQSRLVDEQVEAVKAKLAPPAKRTRSAKPKAAAPAKKASAKKATTSDDSADAATSAPKKSAPKKSRSKSKSADADEDAAPKKAAPKKVAKKASAKKDEPAKADAPAEGDDAPKSKSRRKTKSDDADAPKSGGRKRSQKKADADAAAPQEPAGPPVDGAKEGKAYLRRVFDRLGISGLRVQATEDERTVNINLLGANASDLLGKQNAAANAKLIEALQLITSKAVYGPGSSGKPVIIDVRGFRAGRQAALAGAAERLARFVKESGKTVRFAVVNAFDRRAFHNGMRDAGARTESEGEGVTRRLRAWANKPRQESDETDEA